MDSRRRTEGSPTMRRPFKSRIIMPSFSRECISKFIGTFSVYRVWVPRMFDGIGGSVLNLRNVVNRTSREGHAKTRSVLQLTLHVDGSSMRLHDPRNKAQPQAEPLLRIGGRNAIKTLENMRDVFRRDTDAVVLNNHVHRIAGARNSNLHVSAGGRVFDCIREQIADQPLHLHAIAVNGAVAV